MIRSPDKKWNIGLVEDDPKYQDDIKELLIEENQISQVKVWESAEKFWRYNAIDSLDLLFLDINLPGWNGVRLTHELQKKYPGLPVVMLTTINDQETVFECMKAGAIGYILKLDLERIPALLTDVMNGGAAISPEIALKMIGFFRKTNPAEPEMQLTDQETRILRLVTLGTTRTKIADSLKISLNTVKFHLRNIYKKLKVNNMAALTDAAHKEGLI